MPVPAIWRRSVAVLALACCWAGLACDAQAFWKRGQLSACSDAVDPAELAKHRCWELNGYADPGWPVLGTGTPYPEPSRFHPRSRGYPHLPSGKTSQPTRRLG